MKTILLTGATGFLGSHLLRQLLAENHNIIVLKRSFSNTWRINDLLEKVQHYDLDQTDIAVPFKENNIEVVIHTATNYGRKNESLHQIVHDNLLFPIQLLETAILFKTDAFFNTDTLQYKYLNNYALSKKQFVEWGQSIAGSGKISFVNLSLEHLYGPLDDESKFVGWIIKQLKDEVSDIKLTKGEQKRDFVYVDDVVNAYMMLLNHKQKGFTHYDVGAGISISVREFVLAIKKAIESQTQKPIVTKLDFGALPYREGEPMDIKANITALQETGWEPKVSIKEGIINVI